jgi:hypothetical protein
MDSARLVAAPGTDDPNVQDEVRWDVADGWRIEAGKSMMLAPGSEDSAKNDLPEAWCVADEPWAGGDYGTPGVENDCGA